MALPVREPRVSIKKIMMALWAAFDGGGFNSPRGACDFLGGSSLWPVPSPCAIRQRRWLVGIARLLGLALDLRLAHFAVMPAPLTRGHGRPAISRTRSIVTRSCWCMSQFSSATSVNGVHCDDPAMHTAGHSRPRAPGYERPVTTIEYQLSPWDHIQI